MAQNAADISVNMAGISQNTADISVNAAEIVTLEVREIVQS